MIYKDIPCIKDKAYFIIVGMNGSWLYDALYPQIKDEEFCKRIVVNFESDFGDDDEYIPESVKQYINDSYDDIMSYRASREPAKQFFDIIEADGDGSERVVTTIYAEDHEAQAVVRLLDDLRGNSDGHFSMAEA